MSSTEWEKLCGFVWAGGGSGTTDTLTVMESIHSQKHAAIHSSAALQDQTSAGLSLVQTPPLCGSFLLSCGESLYNTCAARFAFKAIKMQISTFPVIYKSLTGHCFDLSRDKKLLFLEQGADICKISSFWNLWMQNICLEGLEELNDISNKPLQNKFTWTAPSTLC